NSTYNSAIIVLPLTRDGARAGSEQVITTGIWDIDTLDWTPDSSVIVFEGSAGSNNPSLWRIPRSGGTPIRLYMPSVISGAPTVARHSNRMVYVSGQYETR